MNASAYTLSDEMPWAEALAVKGDKFVLVGGNDDAQKLIGKRTVRHDLSGRMPLPGFIDTHMHPITGGACARTLGGLSDACSSPVIQSC